MHAAFLLLNCENVLYRDVKCVALGGISDKSNWTLLKLALTGFSWATPLLPSCCLEDSPCHLGAQ
jgi:hypothetical protein